MGRPDPVIEAYEYPATPWSDDLAGARSLFREVASPTLHPHTRSAVPGKPGPSNSSDSLGSSEWTRSDLSAGSGSSGQTSSEAGIAAAGEQALAQRIA